MTLQLVDQEAEHSPDGDDLPLVLFERGSQDVLVLLVGHHPHLAADQARHIEGLQLTIGPKIVGSGPAIRDRAECP
ncbi:hypothetical protein [Nocardia violaceofusca]|uniref:hypothetical protein n=1 Tax=Nocardia violaceofusca TaxID=941182 RepID=UPI0007A3F512|nr:hypothetical protein [Nocardia violaceofusca]